MKKYNEKKIAIFCDSRKESGGEYQHLIYTIKNIIKNNKYNYKFLIICSSKLLNLELENKFNIEIKYFSLNSLDRYLCYLRCNNQSVRRIKNFFFKNKFEAFLKKNSIDLIYFTSPSQYSLYLEETKFFISVPDLDHREYVEFPEIVGESEFNRKDEIFSKALPKALAIITNSKIIKMRLCYYYKISEKRIQLIHLKPAMSIDEFIFDTSKNNYFIQKFNLKKNYIYYPAMYLPHKNHKILIDVIKILNEKYLINISLVFSGANSPHKKNLINYCKNVGAEKLVNFLNFVEDEALPYLYKNAFLVAFPALIGPTFIPVYEAFKMKLPVIFSNIDGAKEVYEDAVIYVDPFNAEEIAQAVINLKNDLSLFNHIVKKGQKLIESLEKKNEYDLIFEIIKDYRKTSKTWELDN